MHKYNKNSRVLLIDPVGGQGGMDYLNHQLCENIYSRDYDITLVTSSPFSDKKNHRVKTYFKNVFLSDSKYKKAIRYIKGMIKSFAYSLKNNVRIFHFQIFHVGALQLLFVFLSFLLRKKIIISAHDVGSFRHGEKKFFLKTIYIFADDIIVHSKVAQELLIKLGINSNKISHIPLGNYRGLLKNIPINKESSKKAFGFSDDDFIVLFFGQCKKVKRLDVLINAISYAKENGFKNIKLLVAGPVTDADDVFLKNLMQKKLLNSYHHSAYFIPNDDLPKYFAATDIVVLPYDDIMQSGVILLAMSNNLPVIVSNIPGMIEIVEHGKNGLVFKKGNIEELGKLLIDIDNGLWNLNNFIKESKNLLEERYSWENCANLTIQVYKKN